MAGGKKKKTSSDLLMKRFEQDFFEVLSQYDLAEDSKVSEVQMIEIMHALGFIQANSNADIDMCQEIWKNLPPVENVKPLDEQKSPA